MNARRYPRTMDEAYGPYHRSSQCSIVPMDEPLHPVDVMVIKVSAFCCAVLVVIFAGEYFGWWPL